MPTWRRVERFPRPARTTDPRDRDVRSAPHGGELATIGDVFSEATNPGRKKPFEIRRVMAAVIDQDHSPLERWFGMHEAETAVVWDAYIGGYAACVLGFESKPLPRLGLVPADGPQTWTSGTLFPLSSKKVARAINAASGSRPLVVLANLSGFDGSPESMRRLQLEYGAEIGRAVVNFDGPDRVLRGVPLPRRRLRRVLQTAERQHRGGRARGRARVGHRRRAGGRSGLRSRSRSAHAGRRAARRAARRDGRGAAGRRGPRCTTSTSSSPTSSARRSSARWRRSSTPCTTSNEPGGWARSTGSSRPASCAPT